MGLIPGTIEMRLTELSLQHHDIHTVIVFLHKDRGTHPAEGHTVRAGILAVMSKSLSTIL